MSGKTGRTRLLCGFVAKPGFAKSTCDGKTKMGGLRIARVIEKEEQLTHAVMQRVASYLHV